MRALLLSSPFEVSPRCPPSARLIIAAENIAAAALGHERVPACLVRMAVALFARAAVLEVVEARY